MPAPRNDFLPDLKAIHEDVRNPLTVAELRNRLKHIAILCWGLSIDLSTEMSECERIRKENERLRTIITNLGGGVLLNRVGGRRIDFKKLEAMTPEEREKYLKRLDRNRENTAKYRAKRTKEQFANV